MIPATPVPVRLFFIDDSGTVKTGWIVYSWIECPIADWAEGLSGWIDLRKSLYAQHAIPPSTELHATQFAGGRGNPSTNLEWNRHKRNRGQVLQQVLTAIAANVQVRVGTVYRATTATGKQYTAERINVYEKLVTRLDTRLDAASEYGLIFVDGDGSDTSYQQVHRDLKLEHRRIIEDPIHLRSNRNQWVQMADLIAWSAYQGLLHAPKVEFAWDWYQQHLQSRDVNGGPLAV